ncbi:MAG TPA: phosphomannomutase/phosphoglucomutase [Candidatus Ozemobacteraceae bacterium]|nr:phosphomannomutase/phosphoglucomutase [Candidatus Ozemobacteraceae bacterium]
MNIPNRHVFKEYDIRGVVDRDLPAPFVQAIGRAFGTFVRRHTGKSQPHLALGQDVRLSSPSLHDAIVKGLLETGVNVTELGPCPTPVVYFSLFHLAVDGAVQITGSHNPSEFNGFKLCLGKTTIFGADIQELRRLIEKDEYAYGTGTVDSYDILQAYREHQQKRHAVLKESIRPVKVVIDGGNGTAGLVFPQLMRDLGCEVEELYCTVDGRFPNHHPDPTIPENLAELVRRVKSSGADLGLAFDGDSDRLGLVDETGRILWGDEIMILLARDIVRRHPGAAIIGEVKCSQRMYDAIEQAGARGIMWKTGHSLIKNKMKEEHALLAGEMSGHLFFAEEYFGFDDAMHAALELTRILADHLRQGGRGLSELLSDIPPAIATPEIRTDCADERKAQVVADVRAALEAHLHTGAAPKVRHLITIDGVRAVFEQGWGLVRSSNTQPILVSRFEAVSAEQLAHYRQFMEAIIHDAVRRNA